MTRAILSILFCAAMCGAAEAGAQDSPGVVNEVRVHGNHTTPDADVIAIVGDVVGKPATDALLDEMTHKLEQSGRFDSIDVRKRYRSIADPDDVLVMIIVDEKPGVDPLNLTPGPVKQFASSGMFMPILHSEDGYGFTYGGRISFVDQLGSRSRITVPLSWGGERQARVQLEKAFKSGPVERLSGDYGIGRKENPHYEIGDTRVSYGARVESAPLRWLRVGAGARRDDIDFGGAEDTLFRYGADVTLDTRVDPAFPRNAVFAVAGIEKLDFETVNAQRTTADLRGYLGLFGDTVLAVRSLNVTTNAAVPAYEHVLLGGASNLRGYDTGYLANDNVAAVSAELRIPVTSPLSIGRFGVKAFVDGGAAYPFGQKLADQKFEYGYGGGVYLHLTLIYMSLDVAWAQTTGDVRFHFGMGLTLK